MCSGGDFDTFAFFGGHFIGKVKSVFPKSDATGGRKTKDLLQHHMGAAAAPLRTCAMASLIQF